MRRLECEGTLRVEGGATRRAGEVALKEVMGSGEMKAMAQRREGGGKRIGGVVMDGMLVR